MMMLNSFGRRLFYSKPKKSDPALLAQFYYADIDLCNVATELDSFDGKKSPAKCAALVAQLRQYQDRVLKLIQLIMEEVIPQQRASRDFRVKYPEDLIQDGLAGQLWFGAECLSAGSSILNREVESESMRPLAKSLTKQLDILRHALRDQSLHDPSTCPDKIKTALFKFDETFADFELSYVSAMVPVKSMAEYDLLQEVTVLYSETVNRAVIHGLITRDMMEYYDPLLMFTIPRLAIVSGLILFPDGPLNPERKSEEVSEMFRPFQSLLGKIRELLWTLSQDDLRYLQRLLCNLEESVAVSNQPSSSPTVCSNYPGSAGTVDVPVCSLFNTISNINDYHESSTDRVDNGVDQVETQRIWSGVLGVSPTQVPPTEIPPADNNIRIAETMTLDESATAGSQRGSDWIGTSGNEPPTSTPSESLQTQLPTQSANEDIPSPVIINDAESGVARLILAPPDANVVARLTDRDNVLISPSSVSAEYRSVVRQSSRNSDLFVFCLPNTSQSTVNSILDEETSTQLESHSTNDPPNASNLAEHIPSDQPHITIVRSLSQSGGAHDAENSSSRGGNVLAQSDTDSRSDSSMSTSMSFATDSDSSSSSEEVNARRIPAKTFFSGKSVNLRRPYQNTGELIQRLFVCISGVADQLQSNFACDLRNILKVVFDLHTADADSVPCSHKHGSPVISAVPPPQAPPTWVEDSEMDKCCSCRVPFTVIRRKHHCRNCGLIFCGRCSSNSAPLPNYGYHQPVRICNKCYVYRINPFYMDNNEASYNSATDRHHS